VAPPGLSSMATAIFLVDDPRVWSAEVANGVAGFVLRADEDQRVPIIMAVGFDAHEGGNPIAVATLHDVAIGAHDSVRWRVPLAAAVPIGGTGSSDAERIALWRQESSPGLACVMVEHASATGVTHDLVVPRDDHDCDQLAAGECAPWTYRATSSPATIDRASCLLQSSGTGTSICMLGGPTCSEVGGSTRTCDLLDQAYCAPMPLCSSCAPWDQACVASKIGATAGTGIPRVSCELSLTPSGTPCDGSEIQVAVDASAFLANKTAQCRDVELNDVRTPLGAFAHSVEVDSAKLEITSSDASCSIGLKFTGQITQGGRTEPLLFDLALDNGKHLVIPFAVTLLVGTDQCAAPHCQVSLDSAAASDPMFSCAGSTTPPPGACDGQGSCLSGPPCGTGCCNSGESCINGQCKCGTSPPCGGGFTCNAGLISPGCGSICCDPLGGMPLCTF
jgi:hypothetical protein